MNSCNKEDISLSYFTMGEKFLNLARISSDEIVKSKNQYMIISRSPIGLDELSEQIKWSDVEIGIPVLFNFYHGIELMLKGCILLNQEKSNGHHFSNLIDDFEKLYGSNIDFINTVKNYTICLPENSIMFEFLDNNNINIDNWYEALKYPFDKKGECSFNHINLKYGSTSTLDFWQEISDTSKLLIAQSVKFFDKKLKD